jgi:hypothetical protein
VPIHYAIRTNDYGPRGQHLKSWLVETSADGENCREVPREEDNTELNGEYFVRTSEVAGCGECRFIRLVNICRNHRGNDAIEIFAREIFGSLFE